METISSFHSNRDLVIGLLMRLHHQATRPVGTQSMRYPQASSCCFCCCWWCYCCGRKIRRERHHYHKCRCRWCLEITWAACLIGSDRVVMNNYMMCGEGKGTIGQENDSCMLFSLIKLKSGGSGSSLAAATTDDQNRS